ncbi:choice-of-anchor L domain-containing protein [Flavobacterium branchiophilum]|nr:choice-of-anchor L domain-containing protein [Flavobacterium branchiophilum]
MTPTQLVQNVLLGSGVTISNVKFNGSVVNATMINDQVGAFITGNTPTNLGLTNGLILATGNISVAAMTDNISNANIPPNTPSEGEIDLLNLNGIGNVIIRNKASLEFDFIANGNSLSFDFIFASEEYPTFINSIYNDRFGFFLSGPGISGPYSNNAINIALVPSSTIPISIHTVNNGVTNNGPCTNCSYYLNNNLPPLTGKIQYNGYTTVIPATANIQCGETYHVKLAIANVGDNNYDSAVFFKSNSFNSPSISLPIDMLVNNGMAPCIGSTRTICTNLSSSITHTWKKNGITITNENSNCLLISTPGVYCVTAYPNGLNCPLSDCMTIEYVPPLDLTTPTAAQSSICQSSSTFNLNQFVPIILNGLSAADYEVFFYTSSANAQAGTNHITNLNAYPGTDNQTIYVSVTDLIGSNCTEYRQFQLHINPLSDAVASGTATVNLNSSSPSVTFTGSGGVAPYTFTYNINGGTSQQIATTTGNSVSIPVPTNTLGVFNYNITSVTSANNCPKAVSQTATVTVLSLPTATIAGTTATCLNDAAPNITFTGANGVAPYTFTYNINGGANQTVSTTTGNSVTVAAPTTSAGTFAYNLISVADSGSPSQSQTQSGTATITVNNPVNAGTDGTTTVCITDTTSINLFSLITGEQTGGVWTRTSGTGGTFTAASGTFVPTNATNSTFVYTLTAASPCVDDSSQATVNISPASNAGTDGSTTVCENSTTAINLFDLITGEQSGGVWTRTSGTGGTFTAASATFVPTSATNSTFTYTITGTSPCPDDSSLATVNVNAVANAGTDGNTTICVDATAAVNLFSLITGEQTGGVWTRTSGVGGTFNATTGTFTSSLGATTSQFKYTVAGSAPCLDDFSMATININEVPNAGTDGTLTICETSTTTINLADILLGEQSGGVWTRTSGTGGTFNAAAGTFVPAPGASSSFTYTVAGVAPCLDDTALATVTILSAPAFNTPVALQVCDDNNDGVACFTLSNATPQITNNNASLTVTYHVTLTDAQTGEQPLPNTYCNITTPFSQTIYVRIFDPLAPACFSTSSLQLIVNPRPIPNVNLTDYVLCDNTAPTNDGIETFDMHAKDAEIANGLIGTVIKYYSSLADAQNQTNALPNFYTNTTSPNQQTVYFRIQYPGTGCFSIGNFKLIVKPLPLVPSSFTSMTLCDANAPLGFENFDLASQITTLLNGQTGMNVTFYPSLPDANANTNAILPANWSSYTNVSAYSQTLGIKLTNVITGCSNISTMDLIVNPLPMPVVPTTPLSICDTNQNGQYFFDLTTLTANILAGAINVTITYHETLSDAQTGSYPIANPQHYENSGALVQFIYASAVNQYGCRKAITIELNVNIAPIVPGSGSIANLTKCDQTDSNNQDGLTLFDLTQQTAGLLALQTSAASNYTVTYHLTQADALTGANPIVNAAAYYNISNPQTIWASIKRNSTNCRNITRFDLIVNLPLALTIPTALSVCDTDANPNDQFYTFDLTLKNNEITQGLTGYTVTYYPSYSNPQTGTPIANPTAYTNTTPFAQTLGVMVTNNATGCKSWTKLDIRVLPIPTPRTTGIPSLGTQCAYNYTDPNNPLDVPLSVFNLTVNATYIMNGDPNLILRYFRSYAEATAVPPVNEILNPTAAAVAGDVWIRVENTRTDYQGQHCFVMVKQTLTVNPRPTVATLPVYKICDDNSDGLAQFDLQPKIALLLGTSQLPANFTLTFHALQTEAQNGTNALPLLFTNTTPHSQTIYVRIVNNATGCTNEIGTLTLIVEDRARATGPQNFATCDNYGDPYDGIGKVDLTQFDGLILNGQDPATFVLSYFTNPTDLANDTNALTLVQAQNYVTPAPSGAGVNPVLSTIYVKVTNTNNIYLPKCTDFTTINIKIERYPNPIIQTNNGYNYICVDYLTKKVVKPLTLDSQVTGDYTYVWYVKEGTAVPQVIPGATGATYTIENGDISVNDAVRTFSVKVISNSTLGCTTTSVGFDVYQSGPAAPIAGVAYTITNAFESNQIIEATVAGYGTYLYSLDDGPQQVSPKFENVSLGSHTLWVWDIEGGNQSCDPYTILDVETIDYPHFFTPNGDGFNDTWNITGLKSQPNTKIYIFDRNGKLLKQLSATSVNQNEGWDGTLNGQQLPSTDYWFTVDYIEKTLAKQFKAHFSLKR